MKTIKTMTIAFVVFFIAINYGMTTELLSISNVTISDVTDTQFSVVWASNQPGKCDIKIFSDINASIDISKQFTIISASALHPPAESNGVMKVIVKGAKPDTTYYFKTITQPTSDCCMQHISEQVFRVTTEKYTSVMNNNTIVQAVRKNNSDETALGTLLLAFVPDGSYPLSAWVGSGYPGSFAGVDLSNLYKAASRKSFDIESGMEIDLWGFGGKLGYSKTQVIIDESYHNQLVDTVSVLDTAIPFEPEKK